MSSTNSKIGVTEKRGKHIQDTEIQGAGKSGLSWIERQFLKLFINRLIKKVNNMKGSWKTTLFGILTLLGAIALAGKAILDNDPSTNPDFNEILLALSGIGLWAARDNGVTSEDVGAK